MESAVEENRMSSALDQPDHIRDLDLSIQTSPAMPRKIFASSSGGAKRGLGEKLRRFVLQDRHHSSLLHSHMKSVNIPMVFQYGR
jgi:hypothetical protein